MIWFCLPRLHLNHIKMDLKSDKLKANGYSIFNEQLRRKMVLLWSGMNKTLSNIPQVNHRLHTSVVRKADGKA
jgi:hypothetical protein